MPDECEKILTYRRYRCIGEARDVRITRLPPDAPDSRKLFADVKRELEVRVAEDIAKRNAEPAPDCGPCDLAKEATEIITYITEGGYQWREQYSLKDDDGNTITGTAVYWARGFFDIEMRLITKICAPAVLGDPFPSLAGLKFEVPAETIAALKPALLLELASRNPKALTAFGVVLPSKDRSRPAKG